MAIALTHIALHVADLEACISFYQSFAGMELVHDRSSKGKRVVWLASPGDEGRFILVLIPGGRIGTQPSDDFSHLGFAVASKAEVDAIAVRARLAGLLEWEAREEPYPVGYYCGVRDPNGNFVEFSHGQPLGPGVTEESPQ